MAKTRKSESAGKARKGKSASAPKPAKRAGVKAPKPGKVMRHKHPAPPPQVEAAQDVLEPVEAQELIEPTEPAPLAPAQAPAKIARGKKPASFADAEAMAKAQRSISVSEFFAKNRHLLGFDNPRKALLTSVKEAVDNALDACEEAGILPVIEIAVAQLAETVFRVTVQDNGPGIVRQQIPNIFGRLLYGSKFHRLRMSRGQQGIGISAAGMYGLLTTGRPVKVTSRTSPRAKANYCELKIDTRANKPEIVREEAIDWDAPHGTRVEIEMEARYTAGRQSVDDYLQQTAIANPHVTIIYHAPDGRADVYKASVADLPPQPKTVRPHPHGVELGVLIKMLQDTKARSVKQFLTDEFSRVSARVADELLAKADVRPTVRASGITGDQAKAIYQAVAHTKILAPATDSVVPIGQEQLIAGLRQVVNAGFYAASSRSPAVYRGNPFIVEVALAYGKPDSPDQSPAPGDRAEPEQPAPAQALHEEESEPSELAKLIRFANRVPLLYQQSACAIYKSVASMNWRSYGLPQSRGSLPQGPLTVVMHMASVWVPFTSESKEAIASYPEIIKELRLGLQECGRQLGAHIRKGVRMRQELKKRSYIEKYIPAIGEALRDILDLKEKEVHRVCEDLKDVLERSRKM